MSINPLLHVKPSQVSLRSSNLHENQSHAIESTVTNGRTQDIASKYNNEKSIFIPDHICVV